MPMRNSTLIYFVNHFSSELDSFLVDTEIEIPENNLAEMDNTEILPSERTIENILNFARSYEVLKTEETGYVELILN